MSAAPSSFDLQYYAVRVTDERVVVPFAKVNIEVLKTQARVKVIWQSMSNHFLPSSMFQDVPRSIQGGELLFLRIHPQSVSDLPKGSYLNGRFPTVAHVTYEWKDQDQIPLNQRKSFGTFVEEQIKELFPCRDQYVDKLEDEDQSRFYADSKDSDYM